MSDLSRSRHGDLSTSLPGDVSIRDAGPDDAARLVDLLQRGATRPGKEDPADLAPYRRALAEIAADPHNRVLVAEVGGEVVGTCQVVAFRHLQEHGGLCAEVESLHVHPDRRGGGLGGRLLAAAVQTARDWGRYRVQLTSDRSRTDAHRFYERAGSTPSHAGFKLRL